MSAVARPATAMCVLGTVSVEHARQPKLQSDVPPSRLKQTLQTPHAGTEPMCLPGGPAGSRDFAF
ncbi:hypothetical protein WS68_05935 [Burkholderia sp. TSV86]|nr:hypothetical protein WS68_05935 [Burkholderia sp. TSV86]